MFLVRLTCDALDAYNDERLCPLYDSLDASATLGSRHFLPLDVVVFSAGLTAGAFVWGILVDVIGRRWAFNLTVGIVAVFGTYPLSPPSFPPCLLLILVTLHPCSNYSTVCFHRSMHVGRSRAPSFPRLRRRGSTGIILGALDSWAALCGITFFVGFGLGGNIPIDATIVLEFLPNVSGAASQCGHYLEY